MKVGNTIEAAAWLTGEETPEQRRMYEDRVREAMDELCLNMGFVHGPVRFHEKRPGEERAPPVPDHIQGIDVRLLVGECEITGRRVETRSFLGELGPKDLERLRKITRRTYARHYPHRPRLSDMECDDIIEALGPEAALDTLHCEQRLTVH